MLSEQAGLPYGAQRRWDSARPPGAAAAVILHPGATAAPVDPEARIALKGGRGRAGQHACNCVCYVLRLAT